MSDGHGDIERYLSAVRRELSPLTSAEADDLVAELRSHIEESCAHGDDAAVREPLAALGEPSELGRRMLTERMAGGGPRKVSLATHAVAGVADLLLSATPAFLTGFGLVVATGLAGMRFDGSRRVLVPLWGLAFVASAAYAGWYWLAARRKGFQTPGRTLSGLTLFAEGGRRRLAYESDVVALTGEVPPRRRRAWLLAATLVAGGVALSVAFLALSIAPVFNSVSSWGITSGGPSDPADAALTGFYDALVSRDASRLASFLGGSLEASAPALVSEANASVLSRYQLHTGSDDTAQVWERVHNAAANGGGDTWRLATLRFSRTGDKARLVTISRSTGPGGNAGNDADEPSLLALLNRFLGSIAAPEAAEPGVTTPGFEQAGGLRFAAENSGKTDSWEQGPAERADTGGTHGWWVEITALGPSNEPKARWRLFFEDAPQSEFGSLVARAERLQ